MDHNDVFYEYMGHRVYMHDCLISYLLEEEVLLCSQAYVNQDGDLTYPAEFHLCVNCSDVFGPAFAETEDVTPKDLEKIYEMHRADPTWGKTKWVCQKRGMKPWYQIINYMKKAGSWDEEMDNLPERGQASCTE